MKRTVALVVFATLLPFFAGFAFAQSDARFKPGTYSGSAQGKNGPLSLEVTVDTASILKVVVVGERETEAISGEALTEIPREIVERQSLNIDAVSGATVTSAAILDAAAEALRKAGGDIEGLKAAPRPAPAAAGATIAMKPGTYYGEAYGKWPKDSNEGGRFLSPKVIRPIRVEVTVDANSIESVKVLSCDDTPGFKDSAIRQIPIAIVKYQSVGVDVVCGATMTSRGILSATAKALRQAGAGALAFNARQPKVSGREEYSADVAIVGAGSSGTAAALAATEAGAKVLVVEKTGQVGGMGGCSTGFIGVGSQQAKAAGSAKTVQDVFMEMMDYTDWTANPLLVKAILEKSGSTADWLRDHGYRMTLQKGSYTHDTGKGNAKLQALYDDYILPAGAKLLLQTRATELLREGGKVVGFKAKKSDGTDVIVRAKAVVIATGGFGGNPEMLRQYTHSDRYALSGLSTNTGDGINMALAVDAALSPEISPHLTEFAGSTTQDYNDYFMKYLNYGGLLQVNLEGKRFMDESLCASQPLAKGASAIRTAGSFYVVLDQATLDTLKAEGFPGLLGVKKTAELKAAILWRDRALVPFTTIDMEMDRAVASGNAYVADSFEALEAKAGFQKGVFTGTMKRYLGEVADKKDDEFYKAPFWLTPIATPPYYLVRMEPAIFGTIGGIAVNERIEALDKDMKPIPGLYVAGQDGGGMYGYPYYEIVGVTQGYAYNSGRLAGENAASHAAGK